MSQYVNKPWSWVDDIVYDTLRGLYYIFVLLLLGAGLVGVLWAVKFIWRMI